MKKIEIVDGVYSSILGFGCAPILGSIDSKKAARAIDIALDCGINHFDLARSYGYRDAEDFVGKILKDRRSEVVIATKFGIKANWKSSLLKPLKPAVRYLKGHPSVKGSTSNSNVVAVKADYFHDRLPVTPSAMYKSLEQSLRALKTDYIDLFFIHEPLQTIAEIDTVMEMADRLKKEGKIKGIGLAFMQNQSYLHTDYLNRFELLQFNNSIGLETYNTVVEKRASEKNIFFSPLNGGHPLVSAEVKLTQLFTDFTNSVVLCSMFREEHIRANTNIAFKF